MIHSRPEGRHVASLFCQHVAPELPGGMNWDDHRETVADLMIETVERAAPGFKASVIGRMALTPLDLERTFGLVGGDIMHGALTLDQIYLGAAHARKSSVIVRRSKASSAWFGQSSRRRRHGRARPQCGAGDPEGFPLADGMKILTYGNSTVLYGP